MGYAIYKHPCETAIFKAFLPCLSSRSAIHRRRCVWVAMQRILGGALMVPPRSGTWGFLNPMPDVMIQVADPASAPVLKLIEELDGYLQGLYPPESNHILTLEDLRQANVVFLTAAVDGHLVGCGGILHQLEYAEIKRMFVVPRARGLRIGRRILDELEAVARSWGMTVARLETGVFQPEALGLYEKAGYQRRYAFGGYCEHPLFVFMEKKLGIIPGG